MNAKLSGKKILLIVFAALLLVGIPVTIYLVQQQQETRSHAEKSTTLTFTPDSSATAPITKNVGDSIPLDITVNPGKNLVSFVKLEISYDSDKLGTTSATFQPNTAVFPTVMEGPVYTPGKIAVTLSVGPDPTKAIQSTVKAGTVTLKALANTPAGQPTLVTFSANTQVLSIGPNDQASENVLSTASPATIIIGGSGGSVTPSTGIPTGSPTPTISDAPTVPPVDTPTTGPTSPLETPTTAPTGAPTGTGGGATNQNPICSSLVLDRAATGDAPLSITFTANGSDVDGTVSKVTFNFGDGQVSDVTQAGGIGTNTVNAQISHTYNNAGTFQASAILTDNAGGVSSGSSCSQTITVTASGSAGQPTTAVVGGGSPTPTIAATGSTSVALGIGFAALLIIGGGLLFFIL